MQDVHPVGALLIVAMGMHPMHLAAAAPNDSMQTASPHRISLSTPELVAWSMSLDDTGRDQNESPSGQPSPAPCKEAVVSPVTGHADCVRPRGAAVDPPPRSAVPCSKDVPGAEKRGCPNKQTD